MKKTHRGLDVYSEFTDTYKTRVTIQESSSILPRVWINHYNSEDGKMVVGSPKPFFMTPHLSVAQAKRVVVALQKFIKKHEESK